MTRLTLPDLMTARELAEFLRISRNTLSEWHTAGRIPAPVCVGNRHTWDRQEIAEWYAAGCPGRDEWEERRAIAGPKR